MRAVKKLIESYNTFIKYIISAGLSFGLDLGLFTIFVNTLKSLLGDVAILIATICARIISSFFNYLINRNSVFKKDDGSKADTKTLIKYYILVVVQMFISSILVLGLHKITSINETIVKIPVDVFIFMVNYFVQKLYIFKK